MLKIVALCLCWAIVLVSGAGNTAGPAAPVSGNLTPSTAGLGPEPVVTTTKPTTTVEPTTETPTTAPTTVKPTPVPANTTTSTTEKPTTSTEPPKTTTPTIPTTTSAPTTTPAPVPTTPIPPPKDGMWMVNGTNETCIVIRMAAQFNVNYTTKDNKTVEKQLTLPTDPALTNATGVCNDTEQTIHIKWHADNDSLSIHFIKDEKTNRYSMHHVELNLGSHEFPNATSNETMTFIHEADQFPTSLSSSYRCMRLQKLDLTRNGTNGTVGTIEISDLQFQAFRSDKTANFAAAQDCVADVPDLVPIAVGCALTVLVIIILVAYLVGRRRNQARGYVSM